MHRQNASAKCINGIDRQIAPGESPSSLTFIVETVDTVDACTLVIASQQKEVLWVLDLVGQQQTDGLQ